MKRIILFLKWLFIPYGVTKVHPAMALRHIPGAPPGTIEAIVEGKLTKFLKEQKCVICGVKCWARNKKAPPICTTWPCYRDYYSKTQELCPKCNHPMHEGKSCSHCSHGAKVW